MAYSASRQIFTAAYTALVGLPTTGSRIEEQPAFARGMSELPCLNLPPHRVVVAEVWKSADGPNHLELHQVVLTVQALADTISEIDASMIEVQAALLTAPIGRERRFTGAEFDVSRDGSEPIYAVSLRFEFDYLVEATNPNVIIEG